MRIGQGIDAHALVADRALILGGVNIPYHLGLAGHSDADVAIHAVCDALLGAFSLGDLGRYFPSDNTKIATIDSRVILREVVTLIKPHCQSIVNVDITIIAQQPRLSPYILTMRENLANDLQIPVSAVSVKSTTTDRMGFTGRNEGIAAIAIVLCEEISHLSQAGEGQGEGRNNE